MKPRHWSRHLNYILWLARTRSREPDVAFSITAALSVSRLRRLAMEASLSLRPPIAAEKPLPRTCIVQYSNSGTRLRRSPADGRLNRRLKTAAVMEGVTAAADPGKAEVTWQIVVGAVAGVTPFVVAGIEFSKRIIAQRRCEVCGGSGLVLEEKEYFRCPGCGGFLPWQSWKRFFSG
ncbi:hypothetical protein SAY86_011408 [Trapa natans]|uniref:Viral late gene transcription factor 3 zinc ribbon domain-containing protein n=1 Tax=Trapa natans TaxID=22666 RepID=A0AAN7LL21_TRANT|nr:hypothetical protein SAY86_011408 [Trapa natans]